jgi:hypothetical protein
MTARGFRLVTASLRLPRAFAVARRRLRARIIAAALVVGSPTAGGAAEIPDLRRLLDRTGTYAVEFQRGFREVLSTEQYQQTVRRTATRGRRTRRIESEMFFTAVDGDQGWMTIRNVQKVDGTRVPGSHDRVLALLSSARTDRTAALRKLALEGARFNIGNVGRTFNDPTLALMFFAPVMQPRFEFVADGSERIDGVLTYRIRFTETSKPSIIRDERDDLDAAVSGLVHVTVEGRVVRSELMVSIGSRTSGRIRVRYRRDDNVDMIVPVTMDEDYRNDDGPGRGVSLISCTAKYSEYARFQTSVRILPR